MGREGRSVAETPSWAVATVITVLVIIGFLIHGSLKKLGKWLDKTKRKALLAALMKIKEELMLFGVLSLLMGHWIIFFARICVKTSVFSSRFYPCVPRTDFKQPELGKRITLSNSSIPRELIDNLDKEFCPEGHESFASYESLEQLHRFLLVLSITHVTYSFVAVVLAMIKINSWRRWEDHVKSIFLQESEGSEGVMPDSMKMRRLSTFVFHRTSHPWSQHKVLVWLLCFSRQFWSSINQSDYNALRIGFITTHQLPLTYDFHKYMLRSMEEEFRDIVGISIPLWIFSILCILLGYHGTNIYFWLSFVPAILILLIGTKLHHVVVKLAVEVVNSSPRAGFRQFHLRDELFWFAKPRLVLLLIQFISFQNAFEMATYIWLVWEDMGNLCDTKNHGFVVIRLAFGLVSQFWCSFVTFPLYIIVTQMGSTFQKSIISENVRKSLHGWRRKVKIKQGVPSYTILTASTSAASLSSMVDEVGNIDNLTSSSKPRNSEISEAATVSDLRVLGENIHPSNSLSDEIHQIVPTSSPSYDNLHDVHNGNDVQDCSYLLRQ